MIHEIKIYTPSGSLLDLFMFQVMVLNNDADLDVDVVVDNLITQ